MFMPAADPAPVAAVQPDPPRPVPQQVGRVLGLLHAFVAYGKKLADTLRRHADNPHGFPGFFSVAATFRTADLTLILDRIARGLLRAAALEARLNRLAARGRDLGSSPVRAPASSEAADANPAAPIDRQADDQVDDQADDQVDDPDPQADLAPPPLTLDAIIARDRRRPIGAVLVDICHDLGITPGDMDRATWDELSHHVICYGGSLVTLLFKRPLPAGQETPGVSWGYFTGPIPPPPGWPAPPFPTPAATGPP